MKTPVLKRYLCRVLECVALTLSVVVAMGSLGVAQAANWSYVYDEIGRLKAAIAPDGSRADYEYDKAGNITAIRRPALGTLDVSEFTPQSGPIGSTVKILGSGFSTTLASNVVKFNGAAGVAATVTAATATQLTVTVPTSVTGPIAVTVGGVTKVSTESFVYSTVSNSPPTIASLSKTCAAAGETFTVTGTNFDVTTGATKVNIGTSLATITSMTSTSIVAKVLSSSGTGKVQVLTPRGTVTSTAVLHIAPPGALCADVTTRLTMVAGGAAQNIPSTAIGKYAEMVVPVAINDPMTLHLSSIVAPTATLTYQVMDGTNQVIATGDLIAGTGATIHLPIARAAGYLTVYLKDSTLASTFAATVKLVKDVTIAANAATALSVATAAAGQSVRVVYPPALGENYGVAVSNVVYTGAATPYSDLSLRSIDFAGGGLASLIGNVSTGAMTINVPKSSVVGLNSLIIKPAADALTMTAQLNLSTDSAGAMAIGSTVTAALDKPGKNRRYTFSGTQGQRLGLGGSVVSRSALQPGKASLIDPDGNVHAFFVFGYPGGPTVGQANQATTPALPKTGTYELLVEFDTDYQLALGATGSLQVSLSQAVAAAPVVDGASATAATTVRGQWVNGTFTAAAGQAYGIAITNVTYTSASGGYFTAYLYAPDGTVAGYATGYPATGLTLNLPTVAVGGNYSLVLSFPDDVTSSSSTLWVSNDAATAIPTNGTLVSAQLSRAGQNRRFTFSGAAGQQLGLGVNIVQRSSAQETVELAVVAPDGTIISSGVVGQSSNFGQLDIAALPVTGTYQVFVGFDPNGVAPTATGLVSLGLTQDVLGSVIVNSVPKAIATTARGQTARITFAGTAGQNLGLGVTGITYSAGSSGTDSTIIVFMPDGTALPYGFGYGGPSSGIAVDMTNLPMTGTYTIVMSMPDDVTTSSANIYVSSDATSSLVVGTPSTLTIDRPGKNLRASFTGTSGALMKVVASGLTSTPAQDMVVSVLDSSGAVLTTFGVTAGAAVDNLLPALPASGTYVLFISFSLALPAPAATGSVTLNVAPQ